MQLTATTTIDELADVATMSDADLDQLPFGAIRLDKRAKCFRSTEGKRT